MNTLETLTAQMNANYNNDMYANDEDTQDALWRFLGVSGGVSIYA